MCNMKAQSLSVQKLMQRLSFFKSWSKVEVKVTTYQKFWYWQKGLVTRNTNIHVYESPITFRSKVICKVKFFQK